MSDPITICMTIPALDDRCWVFIDPSRPDFAFNREFATADQAADYARGLAKTTGWPIEDAAGVQPAQLPSVPFDDRQARVNEVLWLMSAVAQQDRIDWKDPAFWAEAAKQNAEIIVDAGWCLPTRIMSCCLRSGPACCVRRRSIWTSAASMMCWLLP